MSRDDKLKCRLLSKPKDFTYNEAKSLMSRYGYIESKKGKTSGSRVAFYHPETKNVFYLHKPHPGNELKIYQIKELIDFLERHGDI